MSPNQPPLFPFLCFLLTLLPSSLALSNPDPALVHPFLPISSPPSTTTIPAFPEQSNLASCPLHLPDELFHDVKASCSAKKADQAGLLHHSRCCPVLAAWLYSAYSATALGRSGRVGPTMAGHGTSTSTGAVYDSPLLPGDSETCVNDLGKALSARGIELMRPNETCDMVYCNCGIRLHPLSCPEAFSVSKNGKLVGDESVRKLEKNCLSSSSNVNKLPGLGGCSKCLKSLKLLNKKTSNTSKPEDRTTKMHNKDCQLMGLTWLLAKNRTAYMHTVTSVFRAIMVSNDGSDPRSCTLNSDGMPLAVDSSELSDESSSNNLEVLKGFECLEHCGLEFKACEAIGVKMSPTSGKRCFPMWDHVHRWGFTVTYWCCFNRSRRWRSSSNLRRGHISTRDTSRAAGPRPAGVHRVFQFAEGAG